jgi:polar amino acid transport system substrate-binding protein
VTSLRLRRPVYATGAVAIAAVLALAGCSSSSSSTSSGSASAAAPAASTPAAAPSAASSAAAPASAPAGSTAGSAAASPASSGPDSALTADLPDSVKSSGTLNIASDASYAPNEFFDTDGKTIIGMDADLGKAIAAKLGLKANFENVTFDSIIPGMAGGKYDLGMSSFTDTKAREATVDFVTYFNAGETLFVQAGNPSKVTGPDLSLCGLTIAVEKGTTEESEVPDLSKKCTAAGKKAVTALSSDDQNGANLALTSGRAQVGSADSPVAAYAVKQSNGALVLAGASYEDAPYGIAVPKNDGMLAQAVQGALKDLIADGSYTSILTKWGVQDGAITSPAINGATS